LKTSEITVGFNFDRIVPVRWRCIVAARVPDAVFRTKAAPDQWVAGLPRFRNSQPSAVPSRRWAVMMPAAPRL